MKFFKPYFIFLISALCLFIWSNFIGKEIRYILNVSDTYYVISGSDFYKLFAILLLTLGLVYFVLDKSLVVLKPFFTKVHIFGTLGLIASMFFLTYKSNLTQILILGQDFSKPIDYDYYKRINLLLIIFLQFFFLINIFAVQLKNIRNVAVK